MHLNTTENRNRLITFCNKLGSDLTFCIHSPQDRGYNCIAWAMGFDDRWVDYILNSPKKWWPKGVNADWKPESLVAAFEALGFEVCNNDEIENEFDKVALYKVSPFFDPVSKTFKPEGWTHAARIVSQGVYHSKIGESFDIYHRSGDLFEETSYGKIYQYMRRPIANKIIVERIKQKEPLFEVPDNLMAIILKTLQK